MAMGLLTFPLSFREKAKNVQQRWAKFPSKRMITKFGNKRFFMTVLIKFCRPSESSQHRIIAFREEGTFVVSLFS